MSHRGDVVREVMDGCAALFPVLRGGGGDFEEDEPLKEEKRSR